MVVVMLMLMIRVMVRVIHGVRFSNCGGTWGVGRDMERLVGCRNDWSRD